MKGEFDWLLKGCEHDGSYIPVSQVKALFKLLQKHERVRAIEIIHNYEFDMDNEMINANIDKILDTIIAEIEGGEIMNRTCHSGCHCQYRYQDSGTVGWSCKYEGYCDFQLPRDSRNIRKEGKSPLNAKDFPPTEESDMI